MTALPMHSIIDSSTNWAVPASIGFTEARYVRRNPDEVIVYLSCQTGCRQACRFCHLTQTGQTAYVDVSVDGLIAQAVTVLDYYKTQKPASLVNFNFMARGEPLVSQVILENGDKICSKLGSLASELGLVSRVKISTIMPMTMKNLELTEVFAFARPDIYLSLYSMREDFRRRWLPKALPATLALDKLVTWQQATRKIPVLHWALIEDNHASKGNMNEEDITLIANAVKERGLICDVNLVRYNSANDKTGREPSWDEVEKYGLLMEQALPKHCRVRHIDRVGFDVKASCGMFVS